MANGWASSSPHPFNVRSKNRGRSDPPSIKEEVRLTAVLFARPQSKFVRDNILPHFNYFHFDSATNFDFHCVGYAEAKPDEEVVVKIGKKGWAFDDEKFLTVRNAFEQDTSWKYSGGADLIICNEVLSAQGDKELEIEVAVCLNLDLLQEQKSIRNFETFFQGLVRYAKRTLATPFSYSDKEGLRLIGEAVRNSVLKLLPESVGDPVKAAESFAVRDITKK